MSPVAAIHFLHPETLAMIRLRRSVMANLSVTIKELITERDRLNDAITALESLSSRASRNGFLAKKTMSAAGRARIAVAQRARWTKFRAKKKTA